MPLAVMLPHSISLPELLDFAHLGGCILRLGTLFKRTNLHLGVPSTDTHFVGKQQVWTCCFPVLS